MLKHPLVRLAILGIALLGFSSTFYFMAPLFVEELANGGYPTLAYLPTGTPPPPTNTPEPNPDAFEAAEPEVSASLGTLLATGDFYALAYQGRGVAAVYQAADGQRILHLDDFEVQGGPDLHVYLAVEELLDEGDPELANAVDLGALKAHSGAQSYEIPGDIPLDEYRLVLIWCVPEEVPYSAAALDAPGEAETTP
ncbi:MAG: DM13 domain-containing protein [Anaerolineales bacterium]|nr:DM13 domain-containing protein [Anaerolineales bacterium]